MGLFFSSKYVLPRFITRHMLQDSWVEEYRAWEVNRRSFFSRAIPRACPSCETTNSEYLWMSEDGYDYVKCRHCEMVYVTPCFTYDHWRDYNHIFQKESDDLNEKLISSRVDENYLAEDYSRFSYYINLLRKYRSHGRILDIGCLTGSFLKIAQEAGYSASGVEFRHLAVEHIKKSLNLDVHEGYFEEISLKMIAEKQRFEIITLWETLEHMLYPKRVIEDVSQLLVPGGHIAITVPNYDNLQVKILRERCFHCLGGPGNAGHINMFTRFTLRQMLEQFGFEVLLSETEGSSSYYDILSYFSDRFERIYSYKNAVKMPSIRENVVHPEFLPPVLTNALLLFSPLYKIMENALKKGSIIVMIAKKKT